jgi:hypothetical protein
MLLHGGIHMLGFAKGFGFMEVSALKLPIGRTAGASWVCGCCGNAFRNPNTMVVGCSSGCDPAMGT